MHLKIQHVKIKRRVFRIAALLMAMMPCLFTMAQGEKSIARSSIEDPLAISLILIMLILLLAIGLLAYIVIGAAGYFTEKEKTEEVSNPAIKTVSATSLGILLLLFAGPLMAQQPESVATVAAVSKNFGALTPVAFYSMISVIAVEVIVLLFLLYQLNLFIRKPAIVAEQPAKKRKSITSIWEKLNNFRPVEQEKQIEMDHEYDGIRELDNRLPRWWLYGFYLTIVFAGIYLWRFHISHDAPGSIEEYKIAMNAAEQQQAIYLAKSANKVDEHSVKILTEAAAIAVGQKIFEQTCAACHGKAGEGTVGPNLTDDYWLHGGSIQDIFKTIKYGWPEKGMKSWKDDLSPVQIAQVSSYIKKLRGTDPPHSKEKQGELFTEQLSGADSTAKKSVAAINQ